MDGEGTRARVGGGGGTRRIPRENVRALLEASLGSDSEGRRPSVPNTRLGMSHEKQPAPRLSDRDAETTAGRTADQR